MKLVGSVAEIRRYPVKSMLGETLSFLDYAPLHLLATSRLRQAFESNGNGKVAPGD